MLSPSTSSRLVFRPQSNLATNRVRNATFHGYDARDFWEIAEHCQSNVLSQFGYAYNAVGDITAWTQQSGTSAAQAYSFGYDGSDQLTTATLSGTSSYFDYDKAGNRIAQQVNGAKTQATYNALNQLTAKV